MRTLVHAVAAMIVFLSVSVSCPVRAGSLPFLPISNIGEEISQDLLKHWLEISKTCAGVSDRFKDFPAKADFDRKPDNHDDKIEIDFDESYYCDDGDQTTYNGLLCAAGVELGCRAVADAQDPQSGRWFRSPHRRWMWFARCSTMKQRDSPQYAHRCANGFSPDMNLGVLLYTLHTKDLDRYRHWLQWLDENAATTELCTVDGDEDTGFTVSDCERPKIPWPRVCTEDLGYSKGSVSIFGKYGGNCALRPWDALDFAAVNNALGISPPPRMSNWETLSRELMRVSKEISGGLVPTTKLIEGPPLVFMSLADSKEKYPLHLDAVRVLIRMLILDPELKASNLPTLPAPADLPGVLGLASSDATDPISVNIAANVIWRRNPSNPMFALLAEGATPGVRDKIIDKCPTLTDRQEGGGIDRSHWLWEKGPQEAIFDRNHSMGWDCVFVGTLYNQMRVRKDLWAELEKLFLSFADPTSVALKFSSEALQVAENDLSLKCKALDAEEATLTAARKQVHETYEEQKKALSQAFDTANQKIVDASNAVEQFLDQVSERDRQIADAIAARPSIPDCPDFAPPGCSQVRDRARKELDTFDANIADALKKGSEYRNQANERMTEIAQARNEIERQRISQLARLDQQFKEAAANVLQSTIDAKRELLKGAEGVLVKAREVNAQWKRADIRLQSSVLVWTHDEKALQGFAVTPDLSPTAAPPSACPNR